MARPRKNLTEPSAPKAAETPTEKKGEGQTPSPDGADPKDQVQEALESTATKPVRRPGSRGPLPGHGGRPPHKRDEASAFQVALFVGTGCKLEAVAYRFGITRDTLVKHYAEEIRMGNELNELFWVGSLAAAARKGNVTAIMFALSRKFGWHERTHVTMSDDGEDGIIFDSNKQPVDEKPETD